LIFLLQSLAKKLTILAISLIKWHFPQIKYLPKYCAKCSIFSAIAYGNVKTFSMNFGFEISSGSGVLIHQTFKFSFPYTKMNIFHTFNFEGL